MNLKPKLPFILFRKNLVVLIFLVVAVLLLKFYTKFYRYPEVVSTENIRFYSVKKSEPTYYFSPFNPNLLTLEGWQKLGFTEKQSLIILKYKEIVGGQFNSQAQLKKCYAISAEKFKDLQPYILLPATKTTIYPQKWAKKEIVISKKFNPNNYTQEDWQKLGFSEKQAAGILKYKNYLGGNFSSKEQLKACYMISPENFSKLASYILLPEIPSAQDSQNRFAASKKVKINYKIFDPNSLDFDGWQDLGFTEKQVNNILKYKNNFLKGRFKSLDDVAKCYMISPEKFDEMKSFIQIKRISTSDNFNQNTSEAVPKSLNTINFQQLKAFGFSDRAAASFLAFRKKLNGFKNKPQILQTYNIDVGLTQQLIDKYPLNEEN